MTPRIDYRGLLYITKGLKSREKTSFHMGKGYFCGLNFNKTDMTNTNERLFSDFPEVSTQQWEEKITADLKGKDYEKALVWRTNEGFSVKPYYRAEDLEGLSFSNALPGEFPYTRGNETFNSWLIRQDIVVTDFAEANKKALEILGKGVNSLGFIFDCSAKPAAEDLRILLKDICLEAAEVNFVCSCRNCDVTEAFAGLVNQGLWRVKEVKASANNDPLCVLMLKGRFEEGGEEEAFGRLAGLVRTGGSLPQFRTVGVNGKFFGNSGSSIVQELAYSLSMGAEYLTRLTAAGLTADEAAAAIKFNFSISNSYFMEVARLRAGRYLWAQMVKAFGAADPQNMKMIVHSETGMFNKTVYDPYVNLLRTQTEAMSAALGGAHSITVLPFDGLFRNPSDFSERIARNQQILLKEESYIDKVTDAPGGSYYIENLTASIIDQAWKLFLETEEKGGFLAALREGFIQKQIREMAARRDQNIALRRENLLGTNQFPNFSETIKEELASPVFLPVDFTLENPEVETLKPYRAGQSFETLRYKTDRYALSHKRPSAFMMTMGNLAMRKARAQFSCNFFAVGGFGVIDNNGFSSPEEGLAAARQTGSEIIVLCSSDEEYAEIVPALLPLLKPEEILVIAGNPACRADLEALGVHRFIHVRSNLLEELKNYQKSLNI